MVQAERTLRTRPRLLHTAWRAQHVWVRRPKLQPRRNLAASAHGCSRQQCHEHTCPRPTFLHRPPCLDVRTSPSPVGRQHTPHTHVRHRTHFRLNTRWSMPRRTYMAAVTLRSAPIRMRRGKRGSQGPDVIVPAGRAAMTC